MQWHRCILILAVTLLFGCQDSQPGDKSNSIAQTTLEQARAKGSLRIGYANEAPYAYYDPEQDRLTGEAPEIARLVLKEMGVKNIEGVLTEFGALIPGLKARRFDIIAAGMYITPERCREVAFSNPTYGVGGGFIVKNNNPKKLHSYENVAGQNKVKLGVVAGTVEINYARKLGVPDDRLLIFPDALSALSGVKTGRVDAFSATSLTIQTLLNKAKDKTIERARPFHDPVIDGKSIKGFGAFAVRKEDQNLLEALNRELANFIGSPEHIRTVHPFGFSKGDLPGNVTADQVCRPETRQFE
ncbi:MAG: ectoine/hydroxyectoine ABC transporter substrate-binding protein EhuB [Candidatus Nitronauta litoralis]|uniref:Ectoine/hydroxyectoine ABC transporter substrate-binding protein EhuB n=1 Tax=Candidatus Nitronauta litoralis TaxID=2705533 RepID=A0A7T0BU78_9BACT|nr:MAG: ectoine/hydroxyectoine ABC transporter substrate-binding protein EhuB [Candidatus Nitronauta litoralis]